MSRLTVDVQGVGLLGPGLACWAAAREVLAGRAVYVAAPTVLPAPQRLPSAERRRAGAAIKLAMAVADEAVVHANVDPSHLASVFTASSGEGAICHALCESLAGADRLVSPTRFTNSVHNAAAGYWHIAVASRAASTSLCALDAGFAAGLLEAAAQVVVSGRPVLLVATDTPYPEPLHATRPLPDNFGLAFVLAPRGSPGSLATLMLSLAAAQGAPTTFAEAGLETLRGAIPAAAGLTLLQALAQGVAERRIRLPEAQQQHLVVDFSVQSR